MGSKIKLKEIFEAEIQHGSFYTGGCVAWSPDGSQFYCQKHTQINVVDVEQVRVIASFGLEVEEGAKPDWFHCFALSDDGTHIVSAHKSGLLRLWDTEARRLKKMWKGLHTEPIVCLAFGPAGHIASGGSDSLIRLWDYEFQACKGTLRGCTGRVALVTFHDEFLIGSGSDAVINCWDVESKQLVKQFKSHFSAVTSITFQGKFMASSGRDKVIILWDFENVSAIRTIPVYEAVEQAIFLTPGSAFNGITVDELCVATAGEEGMIKVWDMQKTRILFKQKEALVSKASEAGGLAVTYMYLNREKKQLAVVGADHNIIIHDTETFRCAKQLIGFSDEIVDLALFNKDKFLAMATNSKDIKLYNTSTMNCQLITGHTDLVLSLVAQGNILISAAKDCSVKVWRVDDENVTCLGTGTRHTRGVGAVAISASQDFFASASEDKCIKLWKIPTEPIETLLSLGTQLAHDKDVNAIAVAPNNKLLATGSQDKTIKLWDATDLSLVGILRGHTRGVWTVTFSKTDQILLSTSADSSIRLWNLGTLSCLKSIYAHEKSVLRAEFISQDMQIISTGSDCLVKVWNVKTSECMQTLDKHDERIWALVIGSDESTFYTGGADSQLIKWRDVTVERHDDEIAKRQETALQEQQLANLINQKKMLKALRMALKLDRPNTTLRIINTVIRNQEDLSDTVLGLNDTLKESLLRHASNWNTNSRNCRPAQLIINILMADILSHKLNVNGLGKFLEETIPYTERHYKRMTEYLKDIKYIEYTLKCMQPHTQVVEEEADIKMEDSE